MAKRRSGRKVNIPICLAAILLCLTLLSIHLSSNVFARYTVTVDGNDNARVIDFQQLEIDDLEMERITVIPGVDIPRDPSVTFGGSESATYVFLEVYLQNGSAATNWAVSADGMTYRALYHDHDFDPATPNAPGLTWAVAGEWTYLPNTFEPYAYYQALDPNDPLTASVIKDGVITVADSMLEDTLARIGPEGGATNLSVNFSASVVQSIGFTSPTEAWNSLETYHARTNP